VELLEDCSRRPAAVEVLPPALATAAGCTSEAWGASTAPAAAAERDCGGARVALTAKLATRLLADLVDAYRSADRVEDARSTVGSSWGFASVDEMMSCIEDQANASYMCVPSMLPAVQREVR
jgi:hypothetical protein